MQEREGSPSGMKSRFLMRQRIPRNFKNLEDLKTAADDAFVGLDDLGVGSYVQIFGKQIFVYDCDAYTRRCVSLILCVIARYLRPVHTW